MLKLFFLLALLGLSACSVLDRKECQYSSVWSSIYGHKPTYQNSLEAIKIQGEKNSSNMNFSCQEKTRLIAKESPSSSSPELFTPDSDPSTLSGKVSYSKSCGDEYVGNVDWFSVIGESSDLDLIKDNYCGDALFIKNKNYVQIASFRSKEKAQNFANILKQETGKNFQVKLPMKLAYRKSCGDNYQKSDQWFRVVGDESQLSIITNNYCGDALRKGSKIQVASFTTQSKAQSFANQLSEEIGIRFWIEKYNP